MCPQFDSGRYHVRIPLVFIRRDFFLRRRLYWFTDYPCNVRCMYDDILIRILLLPLALLYGLGVSIRNFLYRIGALRSVRFDLPVISVGNLSVGGTGKTPHIEYLIRWLQQYLNVAVLSRGYGRKTAGFRRAGLGPYRRWANHQRCPSGSRQP